MTRIKPFANIFLLLFISLIAACASTPSASPPKDASAIEISAVPSPPLKSFSSADGYVQEASTLADQGKHEEALRYLDEAFRLNPKDQGAHVLAGVAYTKLGKGAEARREFQNAINIDASSGEAANAKRWLERFNNPLPVAITPLEVKSAISVEGNWERRTQSGGTVKVDTRSAELERKFKTGAQRRYQDQLTRVLANCGLYKVIEGGPLNKNEQQAVLKFGQMGAKIVVVGKSAEISFTEDTLAPVSFLRNSPIGLLGIIPGVSGLMDQGCTFKIEVKVRVDLLETKNANLVRFLEESQQKHKVSSNNVDPVLNEMLERLFNKMALEINNALL